MCTLPPTHTHWTCAHVWASSEDTIFQPEYNQSSTMYQVDMKSSPLQMMTWINSLSLPNAHNSPFCSWSTRAGRKYGHANVAVDRESNMYWPNGHLATAIDQNILGHKRCSVNYLGDKNGLLLGHSYLSLRNLPVSNLTKLCAHTLVPQQSITE